MTTMQMVGAALFGIAILHTFSTKLFEWLAHHRPAHAGLWHMLGEVEVVFGFWAMVMMFVFFQRTSINPLQRTFCSSQEGCSLMQNIKKN